MFSVDEMVGMKFGRRKVLFFTLWIFPEDTALAVLFIGSEHDFSLNGILACRDNIA